MGGVTWTYRYDPFGRRYSKTASTGAVTIYLPDEHNNEAGEYDGLTGNILRENAFDPLQVAPIAVLSYTNGANPVVVFNHRDRLGSVVATSSAPNSSSNGILLGQYIYDAWGQSAPLTGTGFGYAGYRYDAETGLYYNRARYYDPRLGRFLSTDPLGQGPGLNVYAYVGGDPLNLVDPSGLVAKDVLAAIGNSIIPAANATELQSQSGGVTALPDIDNSIYNYVKQAFSNATPVGSAAAKLSDPYVAAAASPLIQQGAISRGQVFWISSDAYALGSLLLQANGTAPNPKTGVPVQGIYEYIVPINIDLLMGSPILTHQRFIPGAPISGVPNNFNLSAPPFGYH